MSEKKAVILLSGGLDSATVVAMAKAEGTAKLMTAAAVRMNLRITALPLRFC